MIFSGEEKKESVPEVKQNEMSSKVCIGVSIGIMLWIVVFMVLGSSGVISNLVMRICIYPVIIALLGIYIVLKSKNSL